MASKRRSACSQSEKKSAAVDKWQEGKSIIGCLRYSFENKLMCDVTFYVGKKQTAIEAHKLILSMRSCVFQAMFNGPMREESNVVIPEVDADIFNLFLRYLYTDDVSLDENNVTGLLYISKKYDVKVLEDKCLEYLTSSLTSQNACAILEQAHLYDEEDLKTKALTCIWEDGDDALKSTGVVDLCRPCLSEILQSDRLIADEETVFQSVIDWSKNALVNLGREVTPDNRRDVLGEVIRQVRYPLLSSEYFVNTVSPTGLLTESEELKILKHIASPDRDVSPFNANPRKTRTQRIYRRSCFVSDIESDSVEMWST